MEIDEFLERELLAEKKEVQSPTSSFTPKIKKYNYPSRPVILQRDVSAGQNTLDSAERQYYNLWERVSSNKLSWNKDLYANLQVLSVEITEKLEKESSKIKRQKDIIKELIEKALHEIGNKNNDAALKLYQEIMNMRKFIPNIFVEEHREINEEIVHLYSKLNNRINLNFINKFKNSADKIIDLVRRAFSSIDNGRIQAAKQSYEEALDLFNDLPKGFLMQKIDMGNDLLSLYRELSIYTQIKNLQQQLSYNKSGHIQIKILQQQLNNSKTSRKTKYKKSENYKLKRLSEIASNDKNEDRYEKRSSVMSKLKLISRKEKQ